MEKLPPTIRLYWQDDHLLETEAIILAMDENAFACDRSCFYPGGGGQPADAGWVRLPTGNRVNVEAARADSNEVIWHGTSTPLESNLINQQVHLIVNGQRRTALARYHTVLHVLNTITLREYDGWITGAHIAEDYARIDFKLDRLSPELCAELEAKVNAVLEQGHTLKSYYVSESEFEQRPELLRTLEVKPPIVNGQVRVVAIEGFDAQACGGTHVGNTRELGHFSIARTENKGKINKRLYVKLAL